MRNLLRVASLALIVSLAVLGLAPPANAQSAVEFKALCTAKATTGASATFKPFAAEKIRVHVFRSDSASASTTVVRVQQSLDGAAWYRAIPDDITNVGGLDATTGDGGVVFELPGWLHTRVYVVSRSAGSISATALAR